MIEILKDMIQAVNLSLLHRSVGAIYLLEPLFCTISTMPYFQFCLFINSCRYILTRRYILHNILFTGLTLVCHSLLLHCRNKGRNTHFGMYCLNENVQHDFLVPLQDHIVQPHPLIPAQLALVYQKGHQCLQQQFLKRCRGWDIRRRWSRSISWM